MEPDRFYRQHVALDEPVVDGTSFRPFWRIRSRLDQLLVDRAITARQWQAAQHFRGLAETILRSSWRTQSMERTEGHGSVDVTTEITQGRIDAGAKLAAIRVSLGATMFRLLELHLVDNASWREIANRYGVHPKTARRWIITALQALATLGRQP